MKLTRETKKRIKEERNRIFMEMSVEGLDQDSWNELKERYDAYTEMLKPSWSVSPDTVLTVAGSLAGILLIISYEKADILASKALGFVLKGRV